ncbi:MAG TPA: V-type ATP synthase subunit F [Clostridiales bacterium]|nr:V-type ATP synthase subunit F [Clostridiales bacterium]
MYKIAVLGDIDSIYGFSALGIHISPVNSMDEATKALKKLADEQYAIIYVTESYYIKLEAEINQYKTNMIPAIIVIPGATGNIGIGMSNIKKIVEQAVGSDIIFNNEN